MWSQAPIIRVLVVVCAVAVQRQVAVLLLMPGMFEVEAVRPAEVV